MGAAPHAVANRAMGGQVPDPRGLDPQPRDAPPSPVLAVHRPRADHLDWTEAVTHSTPATAAVRCIHCGKEGTHRVCDECFKATTTAAGRATWFAAAAIIVLVAAACTALCLLIRGPWWGKAIDCTGFTLCAIYGWWLIWRAEVRRG